MFDTEESVNYLLNYSKNLVDYTTVGYNYCDKLREMEYLVFAGMVSYYGFEYIKEICESFKGKVHFLSRDDLINNRYLEVDDYCKKLMLSGKNPAFTASCIGEDSKPLLGIINVVHSIYIYNNPSFDYNLMLEMLCHELNHIVNSVNRSIVINNGNIRGRTGLSLGDFSNGSFDFIGLEEGINQLQVNDIIKEIKGFTKFKIDDPVLSKTLNNVRGCYYDSIAYQTILDEIRPIYISPNYKKMILPNRLMGDVEFIYDDFKNKLGEDRFVELSTRIDHLIDDSNQYSSNRSRVKQLVNQYVSK